MWQLGWEGSLGENGYFYKLVKDPPAMQETPVQFLGQEDPMEMGKPSHSGILGLPLWLSW